MPPVQTRRAKALAGFRTAPPLHEKQEDTRRSAGCRGWGIPSRLTTAQPGLGQIFFATSNEACAAPPGLGMFLTAYPPFSASHALASSVG
jgi:hypothetical protein